MNSTTFKGRVKDKLYKWKPGMDHCQCNAMSDHFKTTLADSVFINLIPHLY